MAHPLYYIVLFDKFQTAVRDKIITQTSQVVYTYLRTPAKHLTYFQKQYAVNVMQMSIIKLCTRQRRKECFYAIETQINEESTNFFDTFLIPNWRVSYIIIYYCPLKVLIRKKKGLIP